MIIDINIKELVILCHLLERAQTNENYWNKREVDFDDDDFYEIELPDNFTSNCIPNVCEANNIAKSFREKLFNQTYSRYGQIKP
jgi:hypothetical protein